MIEKKNILGVGITNATKKEILEYIVKNLERPQKKLFFVTPNPEFLVLASKNSAFKNILNKADLASADGIGVLIAAKILGQSLKERFTGVDLVESLCEKVVEKPITVGFLGGGPHVAEKTADCLQKKYPALKVGFVGEEWPKDWSLIKSRGPVTRFPPASAPSSILKNDEVRAVGSPSSRATPPAVIDILFVAFGAPKQEMWIAENLYNLPVKIAIGVGGSFDYISGKIPRAPEFVRNIGLEWLFRLIIQPWRIKRQLALLEFLWLVIREKLTKN